MNDEIKNRHYFSQHVLIVISTVFNFKGFKAWKFCKPALTFNNIGVKIKQNLSADQGHQEDVLTPKASGQKLASYNYSQLKLIIVGLNISQRSEFWALDFNSVKRRIRNTAI